MNIIYKYKLALDLADVAATNNNALNTGYAAGGSYEDAISSFSAVGALGAMAADNTVGVGVVPTTQATFDGTMVIYKVYDILLNNAVVLNNAAHVYKLPLTILGVDSVNQKVNSVLALNSFNPATGDIFPLTDRFFYKYDFSVKAIYFGFPHAERAIYNGMGLKLQIGLESTKL